ncbi:unnamed protein product [Arctogadus glacialis]
MESQDGGEGEVRGSRDRAPISHFDVSLCGFHGDVVAVLPLKRKRRADEPTTKARSEHILCRLGFKRVSSTVQDGGTGSTPSRCDCPAHAARPLIAMATSSLTPSKESLTWMWICEAPAETIGQGGLLWEGEGCPEDVGR